MITTNSFKTRERHEKRVIAPPATMDRTQDQYHCVFMHHVWWLRCTISYQYRKTQRVFSQGSKYRSKFEWDNFYRPRTKCEGRYCFTPSSRTGLVGRGVPRVPLHPGLDGVPPLGMYWGTPPIGTGWEYPPPSGLDEVPPFRTGWGTPPIQDWIGTLSPIRRQSSVASTCYAAGGMPLAFTQEDFLVFILMRTWTLCLHH